jgi:Tol biopolymer transport system component
MRARACRAARRLAGRDRISVFGSEELNSPYGVNSAGGLWVVELSGGTPRRLEEAGFTESCQPAWSPAGARIAFWTAVNGQRDIETMPPAAGARVKVTNGAAVDRAPTWSPDGRYLYFAAGELPHPPNQHHSIVAAPDGRTLYCGARQVEANIWMVKRPPSGTARQ